MIPARGASFSDADVMKCLRMLTFLPLEQLDEMAAWQDAKLNQAKEILAFELTKMVHGEEEAQKAQEAAKALFAGGGDAANMPSTTLTDADFPEGSMGLLDLMVRCGLAPSKKEARRLVEQGGVEVNGRKVSEPTARYDRDAFAGEGLMIKKGKKVFHRAVVC